MAAFSPSSSSFPTTILCLLLFFPPRSLSNPSPGSGLVSFTGGKGNYPMMAREFLTAHNKVRSTVAERPFQWDRQLARVAKRWSEVRRADCALKHSRGPFGENMFWGSGWTWRAADAVTEWASEKDFYDAATNSCAVGRMCGHFTQIIWNSTVRIGCGRTECYGGGVIITCNYDPPGNYVGEFPLNATA
ncbi:hypothetical protein HPP92_024294 [Vanilla planifolia]|uniref:SCP domain-containing protein n=1 Tax=Vanilla planifolia TaxID=51239 RepID=A0A835UEJ4_VANPL|nr:hypothetical protein HPP92_024294 [Vanilla planifolia]